MQKEEEAIVEEEEEEEPVSLEEFHKVKSQKKHVQVNKMASKMISENIRNVDAQDWDVEQDVRSTESLHACHTQSHLPSY